MSDASDEEAGAAPAAEPPRCTHRGCNDIAVFAAARGAEPSACAVHRRDGYVDTRVLECEQQGCTRKPLYGTVDGAARRCALHKVLANSIIPTGIAAGHIERMALDDFVSITVVVL
jgi:EsV-1-7 cysteine-rich motif